MLAICWCPPEQVIYRRAGLDHFYARIGHTAFKAFTSFLPYR